MTLSPFLLELLEAPDPEGPLDLEELPWDGGEVPGALSRARGPSHTAGRSPDAATAHERQRWQRHREPLEPLRTEVKYLYDQWVEVKIYPAPELVHLIGAPKRSIHKRLPEEKQGSSPE